TRSYSLTPSKAPRLLRRMKRSDTGYKRKRRVPNNALPSAPRSLRTLIESNHAPTKTSPSPQARIRYSPPRTEVSFQLANSLETPLMNAKRDSPTQPHSFRGSSKISIIDYKISRHEMVHRANRRPSKQELKMKWTASNSA